MQFFARPRDGAFAGSSWKDVPPTLPQLPVPSPILASIHCLFLSPLGGFSSFAQPIPPPIVALPITGKKSRKRGKNGGGGVVSGNAIKHHSLPLFPASAPPFVGITTNAMAPTEPRIEVLSFLILPIRLDRLDSVWVVRDCSEGTSRRISEPGNVPLPGANCVCIAPVTSSGKTPFSSHQGRGLFLVSFYK